MARNKSYRRAGDMGRALEKALDKGTRRFIINTQSKLSAATPVATGRLASSWFVGDDQPSDAVASERDSPGSVTVTKPDFLIPFEGSYYITNNLEYAQRVALIPGGLRVAGLAAVIGTHGLRTICQQTRSVILSSSLPRSDVLSAHPRSH